MSGANLAADVKDRIDPITFEVIRHKIQAIVEEQAITLKAVSGSPVVTEATDFNVGIYLADGSIVCMGPQVIFHAGTMSTVIQSIIQNFSANPGIKDGDMFILNDPYRGAIHQPDISIVSPIFHEGERIAWAGACAHQLDTGGMSFGSWAYGATEVQQEALLLPGVKLVESGMIREDIWQMIMGMTRLPHVLGLDLKAMIAANNVAKSRFVELMLRYGVSTVEKIMLAEIDTSEFLLREKLKKIPDGIYRARDFIEHDGHENNLYQVCLSIHKEGANLLFDMEGTSPQCPGFINSTYSGTRGAIFAGILPILAPDIRWNEGVLRPVKINAPEGSLCNAKWPAPVSGATVSTAWVCQNVAVAAASRMVSCLPETAMEGPAVTKGHMMVMTLAGTDRDGGPFGTFLLDSMAGGGGAYPDHDGLDGSGDYVVPRPCIANVEANEASGPFLYLFRSLMPDTGGAGRMRGGAGCGLAITPHDSDGLHAMIIGHGVEVPNSIGILGGKPGACGYNRLKQGSANIADLIDAHSHPHDIFGENSGAKDLGAKPGHLLITPGDVLAYSFQGGGGFGDPLLRDPKSVEHDNREGIVSSDWANRLYGVVLREGKVDQQATDIERSKLRRERSGAEPPLNVARLVADAISMDLRIDSDGRFRCICGGDLGPATSDWKDKARTRTLSPSTCGPHIRLHEKLELREHCCPECGTANEVEVAMIGQPSLVTIQLKL